MSTVGKTWNQIRDDIRVTVADDIVSGDLDPTDSDVVDEYAHKWADGSEYVIYHHHAMRLFAESSTVSGCEDDAWEMYAGVVPGSVLQIMSTCAYLAMRQEILTVIEEHNQKNT